MAAAPIATPARTESTIALIVFLPIDARVEGTNGSIAPGNSAWRLRHQYKSPHRFRTQRNTARWQGWVRKASYWDAPEIIRSPRRLGGARRMAVECQFFVQHFGSRSTQIRWGLEQVVRPGLHRAKFYQRSVRHLPKPCR